MKSKLLICVLLLLASACNNKKHHVRIEDNEATELSAYENLAYEIRRSYVAANLNDFDSLLKIIDDIYSDSVYIRIHEGKPREHIEWLFTPCNLPPKLLSTCEPKIEDLMAKLKIKDIRYISTSGRKSMEIPIVITDTIGSKEFNFEVVNLFKPLQNDADSLGFWYMRMFDKAQF